MLQVLDVCDAVVGQIGAPQPPAGEDAAVNRCDAVVTKVASRVKTEEDHKETGQCLHIICAAASAAAIERSEGVADEACQRYQSPSAEVGIGGGDGLRLRRRQSTHRDADLSVTEDDGGRDRYVLRFSSRRRTKRSASACVPSAPASLHPTSSVSRAGCAATAVQIFSTALGPRKLWLMLSFLSVLHATTPATNTSHCSAVNRFFWNESSRSVSPFFGCKHNARPP